MMPESSGGGAIFSAGGYLLAGLTSNVRMGPSYGERRFDQRKYCVTNNR
jgi:hypothetical protein